MTPLRQSRKEPVDVTLKFTLQSFHFGSTQKFKLFRNCVASSLEKSRGHKTGPCGTPSQRIRMNEKTSKASFSSQPVDSSSASETHEVLGCFHPTSKTTARIRLSNAAVNAHLQRRERLESIPTPPNLSCKEAPIRSSQLWNATSTGSIPGRVHLASPSAYGENRLHLDTANNSKQQQQQPWEHSGVRGGTSLLRMWEKPVVGTAEI